MSERNPRDFAPPTKPNFTKVRFVTTEHPNGSLSVRKIREQYSGTPLFFDNAGHECDSYWYYPKISPDYPEQKRRTTFYRFFPKR